jgi:tetratricopeptide (TPR) repeat protein
MMGMERHQESTSKATCANCGVTSTLAELYKPGLAAPGRAGLLCPSCQDARQLFFHKRLIEAMGIVALLGGLLWWTGSELPGVMLLSIAVGYAMTCILTPFHELAHALTALALGLSVYGIRIGWFGSHLHKFHLGRCLVEVMRIPVGGMTFVVHPNETLFRTKSFLVVAAGPVLHGLLVYLAWRIVDDNPGLPDWAGWLLNVFILANLFEIGLNLWPRRYSSGFGPLPSDGLALLHVPLTTQEEIDAQIRGYFYYECLSRNRQKDFAGALDCCRQALEKYPNDFTMRWCRAYVLLDQFRFAEGRGLFEQLLDDPELTGENRASIICSIAWAILALQICSEIEASDIQAERTRAEEYSRQAFEALPWRAEIKLCRGGVLVGLGNTGDIEPGMALLRQAFAESSDADSKAASAALQALGSARLGQVEAAAQLLRQAEQIGWDKRLAARIRKSVESGSKFDAQ